MGGATAAAPSAGAAPSSCEGDGHKVGPCRPSACGLHRAWPSRRVVMALLAFRALNALVVQTYHDPDEYWQCHEVAYRLVYGHGMVTWEWVHGLRGYTHILPFATLFRILRWLHLDSSAAVAHAPRLLQGLICGWSDVCLWACAEQQLGRGYGRSVVACTCTSWFVWFIGVRTYSSCMEGALLAAALAMLPAAADWQAPPANASASAPAVTASDDAAGHRPCGAPDGRSTDGADVDVLRMCDRVPEQPQLTPPGLAKLSASGALAALAIAVRPTALMIVLPLVPCFARVCLLSRATAKAAGAGGARSDVAMLAVLSSAVAAALAFGLVIDRLCYGQWVLAAPRFVRFNLLSSGSAYYGTHPWYWYAWALLSAVGTHAPLVLHGIALVIMRTVRSREIGAASACMQLATAVCSPAIAPAFAGAVAVVGLSFASHKELRFLFPIVHPLMMLYAGASLHAMCAGGGERRWRRVLLILAITNCAPAIYLSLWHQSAPMALFAHLRAELAAGRPAHIDLLTRCHQTPGLALLHGSRAALTMLHCPPPALASTGPAGGSSEWQLSHTTAAEPSSATGGRSPHAVVTASDSDELPWIASPAELRRNFAYAPAKCANECDCFFADPAAALARRYGRARRRPRLLRWLHSVSRSAASAYRSSAALSTRRLPTHVVLFDDRHAYDSRTEHMLHRLGYLIKHSYWHSLHVPAMESRRLLLLTLRTDRNTRGTGDVTLWS